MSGISVVLFQANDGTVPTLDWIRDLIPKAQIKCIARIERLKEFGHGLRRPEADYLRDDIYELRIGLQGINYRILYFFHGQTIAVLSHGLIKEGRVSPKDIDRAIKQRAEFIRNPVAHTYIKETENDG